MNDLFRALIVFSFSALSFADPTFRVVTENHPPVQYLHENNIVGPATEVVRDLLKRSGIDADIEMMPWARAYHFAQTEANVLIFSMFRTPQRENKFHWITTVSEHQVAVLSLSDRDDLQFTELSDAKPYLFAVIRGAYSLEYLKSAGFSEEENLFVAATMNEQVNLLLKRKVDLLFTDPATVAYRLKELGLPPTRIRTVLALPELSQGLYLAASLQTSPEWVEKLTAHAQKLHSEREHASAK
ncbi:transporter substrate-binding domain-containing protein [Lacimicrobium sp. SS2-24]|uniref:substrate-binding periplasmic protein n=1 Tax=Lacimicrobium sp. SS2-24 TaxID=2005569 RepID=UPI000B4BA07D|nr:transporter substrate-binding domain-containing protein [Lacimicrobium sp. SS2-24]